ncbi:MaoC family dehydratase [Natronosporangium hydrolyticum]|uniref:MaoC family dehydratase n=1 Tax=Natronosporangium hydrolyticum TaxID=2811111 RepID=A0A895YSU2_9ACTN|nr:MaoC family dehydratase [Natronosporangium hydrolyticum]QSB17098.1 MaoC family dehydratase [Natronosporangium hydrolyticum]
MVVGAQLPAHTFTVTRADLVRYAGASGDFNQIHWNERFAREVGLPGVIAHGMFTMALAGRAVTAWAGAADAVLDFGVRFARPVPVPDDDAGTEVVVSGKVKSITDDRAELELTAVCQGQKVLAQARATVRA